MVDGPWTTVHGRFSSHRHPITAEQLIDHRRSTIGFLPYIRANMPPKPRLSPELGLLLVVLFWAGNFTAAKIAFTQLDPLAFTAIRFAIGSIAIWVVVRMMERPQPLPPGALWRLIVLGVVGNTIYQFCFVEGLDRTSATKASLILAGMPAIVTICASLMGIEHVTGRQRIAVIVATIGVAVVVLARGGEIDGAMRTGDWLLLAAVLFWAGYTLMLRRFNLRMSPLQLTAWTVYTGTPGLIVLGLPSAMHTDWHKVTAAAWGGVLYSAFLSLVAAYVLWNRGIATIGASRTAVYNTIVPLFATVIAVLILHESVGLWDLAGGVLIVGGVLLTGRAAKQAAPAEG
jgi:drug/metabolite transporter (DMT)-like permease